MAEIILHSEKWRTSILTIKRRNCERRGPSTQFIKIWSNKMKSLPAIVCLALFSLGYAHAQTVPSASGPAPKGNVTECRSMMQARKIAGDQRKPFMRDCVKDLLADCQTKAKAQKLQGEGRKAFVSTCIGRTPKT